MHKDEQQSENRHSSLLALYDQTWEEIRRLREFEWKIAATFITLSGGFVALICSESFKPLLTYNLRWILTGAQIFAIIFGIFDDQNRGYILDCHSPSSQRTSAHLPRVRFRGDVVAAKSPSPERWAEQGRALIVGTSLQQETGKL